ncbi:MAG TPA: hypothetical protein VLS27_09115, partial [Gammaproteobacteria bacterium]|nr:hypothetical protein [Gammaproteobacteria bacterium]
HGAEPQRVAARAVGVGSSLFVAHKACLLLINGIEYAIAATVDLVTGRTRNLLAFMHAAEPSNASMRFVAAQADGVLFDSGGSCLRTEGDIGWY